MFKKIADKIIGDGDVRRESTRNKCGRASGIVGIVANSFLCAAKIAVGLFSGTISLVSDGINNLSDAGSSVITLFGFKLAEKKPDKEHPFGHGRMEYCAGLGVAVVILLVAVELFSASIDRIFSPAQAATNFSLATYAALAVSVLSIAVKLCLGFFNLTLSKKIDSVAMKATATDSFSDCASAAIVILSAVLSVFFQGIPFDGIAGAIISVLIAVSGIKTIKDVVDLLLGEAPDPELVKGVARFVLNYDKSKIIGIHDIMIHDYGPGRKIVVLHAEVPAEGDILLIHDAVDNVERGLESEFDCLATIHIDPVVTSSPRLDAIKKECEKIAREINPDFTLHDFRMNEGDTHANVIFDLVVPTDNKIPDSDIKKRIDENLKKYDEKLNAVVTIENSYV